MTVRYDATGRVLTTEPLSTGGIRVRAAVTRVGVLEYRRTDGSIQREYRPAEEVFSAESMKSLEHTPFTVTHPKKMLNPDTIFAAAVGVVTEPHRDGDTIEATVAVLDRKGLDAIHKGLREVSCGYDCRLDWTPGVTESGEKYDCIQRDIVYNHVSLVPKGRAGKSVRLRMDEDATLEEPLKITIDGVEYELDQTAIDAFGEYAAKMEAQLAAAEERIKELEGAEEERADAASKIAIKRVLGKDGTREDVIKKVLPSVNLTGRKDAEVGVIFETAVAHFDAAQSRSSQSIAHLRMLDSAPQSTSKKVTAEQVRLDTIAKMRENSHKVKGR